MKPGDEYEMIEIMTAVKAGKVSCKGCYFQLDGNTATTHRRDPCRLCDKDFIFERSVILKRRK